MKIGPLAPLFAVAFAFALCTLHRAAFGSPVVLRNAKLSVEIDSVKGCVTGLDNLLTGERHRVESVRNCDR